jgi:hypothetical protein
MFLATLVGSIATNSVPNCQTTVSSADLRPEDRVFAVLKLSYNEAEAASVVGGVCGTGFFIGPGTAISAYHLLNRATFSPNPGYRRCQVWIVTRHGKIRPLHYRQIAVHPEIDTTVIRIDTVETTAAPWLQPVATPPLEGRMVRGLGHAGDTMPKLETEWRGNSLWIKSADLHSVVSDRRGFLTRSLLMTVSAADVNVTNVHGFELSFGSRVGMSGGPVVDDDSGEIVGMLSFGLPQDAPVKTQTFAISMEEIFRVLNPATK